MTPNPSNSRNRPLGTIIALALVGLAMVIGGLFLVLSEANFEGSAAQTQATMVDLEGNTKAKAGSMNLSTQYAFTVKGVTYRGKMKGSQEVGSSVDIEYRKTNPSDNRVAAKHTGILSYVLLGLGAVGIIFSLFLFFRKDEVLNL